jgi:hypothetical protein
MGYTHSHRCWVGIAPVREVETHQKWDAVRKLAAGPSCASRTSAPLSRATSRPWYRPGTQQNPPRPVVTT